MIPASESLDLVNLHELKGPDLLLQISLDSVHAFGSSGLKWQYLPSTSTSQEAAVSKTISAQRIDKFSSLLRRCTLGNHFKPHTDQFPQAFGKANED